MAVTSDAESTTRTVKRQYERFPYPRRNAADERKRLVVTGMDDLGALNHYCFQGRRDFSSGFRALVAGGGTGDAVVYLAHQLRTTNAKIVYVDLSQASMDVARKRIETRGLGGNVQWVQGSLLDIPKMGLAPFDYVNCSGVLHHLADPVAGLAALRSVMKEDGALGIMVYGQYGRTGVYQMQELMRLVNEQGMDEVARVDQTLAMLRSLPETNWFRRGRSLFSEDLATNDVEVYDLFLHSQDRAYTVPQLYEYLGTAGLNLQEFSIDFRVFYNPLNLIHDPELRAAVQGMSRPRQQAIAELFCGSIIKHACWATPAVETKVDLRNPDNVPYFSRLAVLHNVQKNMITCGTDKWSLCVGLGSGAQVKVALDRVPVVVRFCELIDDRRTMGEIVSRIAADYATPPSHDDVWRACLRVIEILQAYDLILLRHKSSRGISVD